MAARDTTVDAGNDLNPLDGVSRERWSMTHAAFILYQLDPIDLKRLVVRGEGEFIRHARHFAVGHAYQFEDYKRMFAVLRMAAENNWTTADLLKAAHGNKS
jgi:hypothetical protein